MEITKEGTAETKGTKDIKEGEKLNGLIDVLSSGLTALREYVIETNSKNIVLKELEMERVKNIELIEKTFEKTHDILEQRRLVDIAREINEKFDFAKIEIDEIYSSKNKLSLDTKLAMYEEVRTITLNYYSLIMKEVNSFKSTTS